MLFVSPLVLRTHLQGLLTSILPCNPRIVQGGIHSVCVECPVPCALYPLPCALCQGSVFAPGWEIPFKAQRGGAATAPRLQLVNYVIVVEGTAPLLHAMPRPTVRHLSTVGQCHWWILENPPKGVNPPPPGFFFGNVPVGEPPPLIPPFGVTPPHPTPNNPPSQSG